MPYRYVLPTIQMQLPSHSTQVTLLTELSPSRDLEHGTVFLSSSPTVHLLAPSENISRPICFHCHSRAQNNTLLNL